MHEHGFVFAWDVKVTTDKSAYHQNEQIVVKGSVWLPKDSSPILIQIFNPKGAAYRFAQLTPSMFGSFSYIFHVDGLLGIEGEYIARVTYNNKTAQTTFRVIASSKGMSIHAFFLFIDIVGLTRKGSTSDQILKIDAMNASIRDSKWFRFIQTSNDVARFIYPTGDGAVIGFTQFPEAALGLAIEVQKSLRQYNGGRDPDDQVKVRMGIDSRPVFAIKDLLGNANIYGPAIVGARRIMDLGGEDHILVSEGVRKELTSIAPSYEKIIEEPRTLVTKHGKKIKCCNAFGDGFGNKNPPSLSRAKPKVPPT